MTSLGDALARMDGIEKSILTKLDAKFAEMLVRLPPPAAPLQQQQQQPPSRHETALREASRVPFEPGQPVNVVVDTSVAPAAAEEEDDYAGDYEDEVDKNQNYMQQPAPQPPGCPYANNRNGRDAPHP